MRISTFGYVGKQGVKNIWRNKMFSLASIATMSACIFLFGLFFSIIVNFQHIIKTAEEGVAITVFFEEDATDSEKKAIGKALEARKDVAEVKYISAEEAWEEFQKQYFACSTLICMIMSMYTGHKMISGNKRTRKQVKKTEAEES